MTQKVAVTAYVPCFNAGRYIEKCLDSLLAQTYHVDEILVIDDGSTDDTISRVSKYPVKIIKHEKNKGLAAARNTAFKNASHEFVASLDADVVADPEWLDKMMSLFTDEKIAGVSGKMVENYTDTLPDRWRAAHMKQYWGEQRVVNPMFLFGCNTVYRKSAVAELGYFDEKYRTNYEDVDMGNRLREKGYKIIYDPTPLTRHYQQDTIKSLLRRVWGWNFSSRKKTLANVIKIIGRSIESTVKLCYKDAIIEREFKFLPFDILQGIYCIYRALTLLISN